MLGGEVDESREYGTLVDDCKVVWPVAIKDLEMGSVSCNPEYFLAVCSNMDELIPCRDAEDRIIELREIALKAVGTPDGKKC